MMPDDVRVLARDGSQQELTDAAVAALEREMMTSR